MNRKKWTPKTEVTPSLIKFREKRKWQIALRRYVLTGKWASPYAPYFGLDTLKFREWIELQFDKETNWDNFSKTWQFDHIVPVVYFDFEKDSDLKLCWNFINIRIERIELNKNRGHRIDVLGAKTYFEKLYRETGYNLCGEMVNKIEQIEVSQIESSAGLEGFIKENKQYLETIASFSPYEYDRLNEGIELEQILEERAFSNKFS
jgi:hypothetical protein